MQRRHGTRPAWRSLSAGTFPLPHRPARAKRPDNNGIMSCHGTCQDARNTRAGKKLKITQPQNRSCDGNGYSILAHGRRDTACFVAPQTQPFFALPRPSKKLSPQAEAVAHLTALSIPPQFKVRARAAAAGGGGTPPAAALACTAARQACRTRRRGRRAASSCSSKVGSTLA